VINVNDTSSVPCKNQLDDRAGWRAYWARLLPFQRTTDFKHLLDGFRKSRIAGLVVGYGRFWHNQDLLAPPIEVRC
jgi:hypothetical protein